MVQKWNIDQIYCNNKSRRPLGHPCNGYNHDWDDAHDDDDDDGDDDGSLTNMNVPLVSLK